jgi:hypothetical protein
MYVAPWGRSREAVVFAADPGTPDVAVSGISALSPPARQFLHLNGFTGARELAS